MSSQRQNSRSDGVNRGNVATGRNGFARNIAPIDMTSPTLSDEKDIQIVSRSRTLRRQPREVRKPIGKPSDIASQIMYESGRPASKRPRSITSPPPSSLPNHCSSSSAAAIKKVKRNHIGAGAEIDTGVNARESEAIVWEKDHVDFVSSPGKAVIHPAEVDADLFDTRDIFDHDGLAYVSLFHTVHRRLLGVHGFSAKDIVWPKAVTIRLNFNKVPELRSLISRGRSGKKYKGIRECTECRHGKYVGWVDTVCVSNDERAGCFCCQARKMGEQCSQYMVETNPIFFASEWQATVAEREAVREWAVGLDVAVRMSQIAVMEQPPQRIVPDAIISLANELLKVVLPEMVKRREVWYISRLEIGAENSSREGDVQRLKIRSLDKGRKLVWSMAQFVKTENKAYDRCKRVNRRANELIIALRNEIRRLSHAVQDQYYIRVLITLINFLSKDEGILALFDNVKEAREVLYGDR